MGAQAEAASAAVASMQIRKGDPSAGGRTKIAFNGSSLSDAIKHWGAYNRLQAMTTLNVPTQKRCVSGHTMEASAYRMYLATSGSIHERWS